MTLLFEGSASAQQTVSPRQTRYRLIQVFPQDPQEVCADRLSLTGLALNDCGVVTGRITAAHEPGCQDKPFVWSLCDGATPFPARSLRNLAALVGAPLSSLGEGRDVNNDGIVVGLLEASEFDNPAGFPPTFSDGRPWYWDLWSYSPGTDLLTDFGALSTDRGAASAVNNDAPAMAVGYLINHPTDSGPFTAFRVDIGAPTSFTTLNAASGDGEARALDTTTPASSGIGRVVGASFDGIATTCNYGSEAVSWNVGATVPAQLIEDVATPTNFSLWGAEARAANAQGQSAGYRSASVGFGCDFVAAFWEASGAPVEIGLVSPLGQETRSQAEAMTAADAAGGRELVVGWTQFGESVVWWRPSIAAGFEVTFGTQLAVPAIDLTGLISVREFVDVNELGWILGNAEFSSGTSPLRPVLFIPDPCPWDLDADGSVGASDLAMLLGAWGPCALAGFYCEGDLDADGEVGASDLALLLGLWGQHCTVTPCDGIPCDIALIGEGEVLAVFSEGEIAASLAMACASLGFSDVPALQAWLQSADDGQGLAVGVSILAVIEAGGSGQ